MYLSFGQKSLFITKQNQINSSLEIQYKDFCIRQVKASLSNNMTRFNSLIGLKRIRQFAILIVASQVHQITTIGLSAINEIKRISWIAVAPEHRQQSILSQLSQLLQEIQQVFVDGLHYYSQLYDLSLPYVFNKIKAPDFFSRQYYQQFIWNLNLGRMDGTQNKAQQKLFQRYCNRIIQGFLEVYTSMLPNSQKIKYTLISRRSTKKAGTRFYARGIDDQGNVANFVETEQIVQMNEIVFTHLQIRGSVPAFFAQTGVNGLASQMVIERTAQLTLGAFTKHFTMLNHMYKRIFCVNLLSQKKTQEKTLSNFYQELVDTSTHQMPYLRYQFYDFHQQCRNNKFENSENLIEKLTEIVDTFGFTCYDVTSQKFLKEQTGVFRTNCLDCLDRTNYIQSRLALKVLKAFLIQFGGKQVEQLIRAKKLLDLPVNMDYPLLTGFNSLWADNGDSISLLYTGIQSTHTDITRTGERTIIGSVNHKFRSLMRFYTQFTDHKKQNGINNLVMPTSPSKSDYNMHEYHTTLAISLEITEEKDDIIKIVKTHSLKERPTLIAFFVFSNQQSSWLDKLKCYFRNDGPQLKAWISTLTQFSEQNGYVLIGDLQNQSCWLGIFCKRETTSRVSQIKKENLSSSLSSGEALLIKMKLESSYFLFAGVNCSSLQEYLKVFDEIHEKGFQTSKLGLFKSSSLFDLDYRVVLGNTGAKNRLSQAELGNLQRRLLISKQKQDQAQSTKIITQVLDADEMNLQDLRYRNKYIRQYNEGPIGFIPTANRLLFWNQEGVILRVRNYMSLGISGLIAVLDYQIGRGYKMKKQSG